jgi:hypothetical protein
LGDLYVALAGDLKSGTQVVPDFREAVWLQKLLEQASTTALGSQQVAH